MISLCVIISQLFRTPLAGHSSRTGDTAPASWAGDTTDLDLFSPPRTDASPSVHLPILPAKLAPLYQHSVRLGFSFTFSLHFHFLPLFYIFLLKHFLPNDTLHNYFQLCEISPFKTPSVPPYMDVDFIVFINKKYS